MSQALIEFARNLDTEDLFGDQDYYISATVERNKALLLLAAHIEEQDKEILQLKLDQKRLLDKIIDR